MIFFFDIDGTLMPFGKDIPASATEAIHRLRADGHKAFLATGRSPSEVSSKVRSIGFDGAVYSSGAAVEIDGKFVFHRVWTKEEYGLALAYFASRGFPLILQSDSGTYLTEKTKDYWYSLLLDEIRTARKEVFRRACSLPGRTVSIAMGILVLMIFSKYFFNACMTSYFTFYLIEKFGVTVQQSQVCLFAYLAAFAAGTLAGGFLGDRFGRKYVILVSILGAAPFTLAMPYLNLFWTVVMAVITGLVISSAFSAIVVYATDLKPDKVGMVAGIFFGLMFGLGGIGSAFFGWLADLTSIEFIFKVSTWLPLLGIVAIFLPDIRPANAE